jgi:probable HAF family extracellular repeat protein
VPPAAACYTCAPVREGLSKGRSPGAARAPILTTEDVLNVAYGINEGGQIVGVGVRSGALHAFLLDPADMGR